MFRIYLDLANDAKSLLFQKLLLFGGNMFFPSSARFLVLGRFEALGPPITVLTKI